MNKIVLLAALLSLSACGTVSNNEGRVLDASSKYCQDIRIKNPEMYYDMCESMASWQTRDSTEYDNTNKKKSVVEEIVESAADEVLDAALN